VTVYRLFPYDESAAPNERGGALFVPPGGRNRIDNPRSYSALYVAANPEAAIAETFGRLAVWTPETFCTVAAALTPLRRTKHRTTAPSLTSTMSTR